MATLLTRAKNFIRHGWNAFIDEDPTVGMKTYGSGTSYGTRPDRIRTFVSNERSLITSIYTSLAIDVSAVDIRHVRTDDENRYLEDVNSGLQECLTLEANIDQAARHFRQDIAMTLFTEGCLAIVPVDTDINPAMSGGFDIKTLRVGRITAWNPQTVRVDLYDQRTGQRRDIELPKKFVAIIENPLYSVMNETNSTLQRVLRKLSLLDAVDEASSSGKLDMVIQLPYVIKSEARRQTAEQRRTDIEVQLRDSKYGIAYIDGTEKITQLNRAVENNLLSHIKYLMEVLYGQLGLTPEVMNGTADEKTMLNYYNRTIDPIVDAIVEGMRRSFLTKTARTRKQTIMAFRNPFKMVPITEMAEIADKFTRNEVLSSNEIRQFMGIKPSNDPKADKLINSNMPQTIEDTAVAPSDVVEEAGPSDTELQGNFDDVNGLLDGIFSDLESVGGG